MRVDDETVAEIRAAAEYWNETGQLRGILQDADTILQLLDDREELLATMFELWKEVHGEYCGWWPHAEYDKCWEKPHEAIRGRAEAWNPHGPSPREDNK